MSRKGTRRYDGKKLMWLRDGKKLVLLVLILFLVFRFVIGFSVVSGVSMRTTLNNGDIMLYTRVFPEVKRGDIISVRIPTGEYYVKRVIALGGDTVDLIDGTLYINGEPEEGDYIRGATLPEPSAFSYPYTIPEDQAFVLGDNREESIDSRSFGAVSLRQIRGIIKLRAGLFFLECF